MATIAGPPSTLRHRSVQEIVADGIRDMILNGQLRPGDRLRQDDLAATFGVSAIPIREALRQLQAEGLVTFYPRRGARVAGLSASDFEEISQIREALETLALRWATENFDQIPTDRLEQLLAEIEAAEALSDDVDRRLRLVREYFFTIFQASGKAHVLRILSSVWDLSQQYRRYFSSRPELVSKRLANYRSIYRACRARDAEQLTKVFRDIWLDRDDMLVPLVREEEAKERKRQEPPSPSQRSGK